MVTDHTYAASMSKSVLEETTMNKIDLRIRELQARSIGRPSRKRKTALQLECDSFLSSLPEKGISLKNADPKHILKFLAYKDNSGRGRTQVHVIDCQFIGRPGLQSCDCPRRMCAQYMKKIVGNLRMIMHGLGRGWSWDEIDGVGNPASSVEVEEFCMSIAEEQAEAHVVVKQAVPLYPDKLIRLAKFLSREMCVSQDAKNSFLLCRDKAFFLLQYFMGERGGDLSKLLVQEVYRLKDQAGLVIRQTFGKGRADEVSVVKHCTDDTFCPVCAVDEYVERAKEVGIVIDSGFFFRKTERDSVLDTMMTQPAWNKRLRTYLVDIGAFEGETTHSLRGGCAIVLKLCQDSDEASKVHLGWKSQSCWEHYTRSQTMDSDRAAKTLATVFDNQDQLDRVYKFKELSSYTLSHAFGC